jgi:hypothetical protein
VPFIALGAGDGSVAWAALDGKVYQSRDGGSAVFAGKLPAAPTFLGLLTGQIFARITEFASPPEDGAPLPPSRHRMFWLDGGRAVEIASGETPTQADGFAVAGAGGLYWVLDSVLYQIR